MKIGVVGTGYWGSKLVRELQGIDGVEVECHDPNPNPTVTAKYVSSFDDLLSDCDGIVIAAPSTMHHDLAVKSLERGIPTFVEKPIATDSKEAEELLRVSMKRNVVFCVGHIFRYNNLVKRIKEEISNRKVHACKFEWGQQGTFKDRDLSFDLYPHLVSMLLYLFGEPIDVEGAIESGVTSSALLLAGNVVCELHIDWTNVVKTRELTIIGDGFTIHADPVRQVGTICEGGNTAPLNVEPNNTIRDELMAFIQAIKGDVLLENNGFDGWKTVKIIEEIRDCA